jgi:hypothetical protein
MNGILMDEIGVFLIHEKMSFVVFAAATGKEIMKQEKFIGQ